MQKKGKQKIVIIGCGNLAWHLAKHFFSLKKFDVFAYNHKPNKNLQAFKTQLQCNIRDDYNDIISEASYYFICVSDKYISGVSKKIQPSVKDALVIHTSGSKDLKELDKHLVNTAVFYPLQTFSKQSDINWKEVPVLIEASNNKSLLKIKQIAGLFSENIISLKSAERSKVHLAAVLVNNFTNALFAAADNFISERIKDPNVNFKLLLPLIGQTVSNLNKTDPVASQTGPAKRNDKSVLKQHLKLLAKDKELRKIYKQISGLIKKQQA